MYTSRALSRSARPTEGREVAGLVCVWEVVRELGVAEMEAEEVAWKGMKGIGKGLKAGASGALKVAEKTSMAVLETNDKINELQVVLS